MVINLISIFFFGIGLLTFVFFLHIASQTFPTYIWLLNGARVT